MKKYLVILFEALLLSMLTLFLSFFTVWVKSFFYDVNNVEKLVSYYLYDTVFLVPFIETIITIFILKLLLLFFGKYPSILLMAAFWGVIHSLVGGVTLAFIAYVAFFSYGVIFYKYKNFKIRYLTLIMMLPHSLHNYYMYYLAEVYLN
ncbi:hypothetical protein N9R79_01955 [Vibrio sp.]|nr:hypothetical protein [Vibrio sp.]